MKYSVILLAVLLVIFSFAACTNENVLTPVTNTSPVAEVSSLSDSILLKNRLLNDYAKALANAVAQGGIRKAIHTQVNKKFDGDFEVLVNTLERVRLEDNKGTFGQVVKQIQTIQRIKRLRSAQFDTTSVEASLTELIPNVQVAMPVGCEEWDPKTQIPMVAVIPYDYVEKAGNQIVAYDANGDTMLLSTDVEPNFPVLVVGRSERVDENGQMDTIPSLSVEFSSVKPNYFSLSNKVEAFPADLILSHGSSKSLLLQWADVSDELGYEIWRMSGNQFVKIAETVSNDNTYVDVNLNANTKYWYKVRAVLANGFSSWSPVMATTASERSDNQWLKIKRMKFSPSAIKAVESWISGAPEIRLRVVQGSENGATTVFTSGLLEPSSRSRIIDTWWNREVPIFAWSTSVYGTILTFDWREEDWLDHVDFNLNGSYEDKRSGGTLKVGGIVTIKGDQGADVIGNTSVMWWQLKDQIYNLSGFQWQFENEFN